jgi:hypothetical protein
MSIRNLVAVTALGLGIAVSSLASADAAPAKQPCSFHQYQVRTVKPYVQEKIVVGRITSRQTLGAQVFVQAEPGLTAEWLRLKLERHLAAMRGPATMPNCALDVKNVRILVESAGAGFNVKLIAANSTQGKEVLRRAQLLVQ